MDRTSRADGSVGVDRPRISAWHHARPRGYLARLGLALLVLGSVLALGAVEVARAQAGNPPAADASTAALGYDLGGDIRVELRGAYRFRLTHRSEMLLAEIPSGARGGEQVVSESQTYTEHRLRLAPTATLFEQASVHTELDLFTGMLSGDTSGREHMYFAQPPERWNEIDGFDLDDFVPLHLRHVYGRWESPVGRLQVGRMGSDWGMGLLASSGADGRNDFGDAYYGDIVDRVMFATKPLAIARALAGTAGGASAAKDDPLILALGYDWNVVRDNLVKRAEDKRDLVRASSPESTIALTAPPEDDEVDQWIGAVRIETDLFEGGFYAARRELVHQDVLLPAASRPREEYLRVWVLDVHGKATVTPAFLDGGSLFAEAELAAVTGETNLTVSRIEQSPATPFPESDVEQLGLITRGGVRSASFDVVVEGGYASGDADPFDTEVRGFRFHPDLNVGLILFERQLAETSASSARNAVLVFDEGGPVRTLGADLLATNGGVTNAIFLSPRVRVRPWADLEAVLGVLWARTATDYVDPATDFIRGGAFGLFNPFGAPASHHDLGVEVDVALRYPLQLAGSDVELGLEYGHLFPGNVFENDQGERMADVDLAAARLTLRF